jgi:hypothetical protein
MGRGFKSSWGWGLLPHRVPRAYFFSDARNLINQTKSNNSKSPEFPALAASVIRALFDLFSAGAGNACRKNRREIQGGGGG